MLTVLLRLAASADVQLRYNALECIELLMGLEESASSENAAFKSGSLSEWKMQNYLTSSTQWHPLLQVLRTVLLDENSLQPGLSNEIRHLSDSSETTLIPAVTPYEWSTLVDRHVTNSYGCALSILQRFLYSSNDSEQQEASSAVAIAAFIDRPIVEALELLFETADWGTAPGLSWRGKQFISEQQVVARKTASVALALLTGTFQTAVYFNDEYNATLLNFAERIVSSGLLTTALRVIPDRESSSEDSVAVCMLVDLMLDQWHSSDEARAKVVGVAKQARIEQDLAKLLVNIATCDLEDLQCTRDFQVVLQMVDSVYTWETFARAESDRSSGKFLGPLIEYIRAAHANGDIDDKFLHDFVIKGSRDS